LDSTTAFGVPSDPEVNRITAGFSGSWRFSGNRHISAAKSLSTAEMLWRISSSQTSLAPPASIAATMSARLARSTNARDETTVRITAVRIAAVTFAGPAVWLIMAAVRPAEMRPINDMAMPFELGSNRPTASPGALNASNRPPRMRAPANSSR
jgi:hypothetical protein